MKLSMKIKVEVSNLEIYISYNNRKFKIKCEFRLGSSALPGSWNHYRYLSIYNENSDSFKSLVDDRTLMPFTKLEELGVNPKPYHEFELSIFTRKFIELCCEYIKKKLRY